MITKCKRCSLDKQRIKTDVKHGLQYKYVDQTGRMWRSYYCPDCKSIMAREDNWKRGIHRPIDLVESPITAKGRQSERLVKEFLESLGHSVVITSAQGPDLIVNGVVRVEVKSAVRSKEAFCVGAVCKNRRGDHLIAIVKDRVIVFEGMKEHLSKCNSTGMRHLTASYFKDAA